MKDPAINSRARTIRRVACAVLLAVAMSPASGSAIAQDHETVVEHPSPPEHPGSQDRPSPPEHPEPQDHPSPPELPVAQEHASPPEVPAPQEHASPPEVPVVQEHPSAPEVPVPQEHSSAPEVPAPQDHPSPPEVAASQDHPSPPEHAEPQDHPSPPEHVEPQDHPELLVSQDHPSPPEHPEVQDHPSPPEPPDLGEVPTPVDSGSASSAGGRDTPAAPEPPAPEPPAVAPELQPVPGPVAPQTSPSVAANPKGANANDSGEVAGDRSGSLELAFDRDGRAYRAGEIVIIGAASDLETIARLRLPIIEHRPLTGLGGMLFRIAVPLSVDPQAVRAQLASAIPGAATDLNHVYRLAAGAGSSARATQASVPHRVGAGIVGIIDTGVDARATELAAAVIETRRFAPGPAPSAAHGAAVAYIAAQHGAKVLDADVFTRDRADSEAASVDAMARAVDWLAGQGVAVINMSLEGPPNQALAEVVRRAQAKGCIVVAAVGNGGPAAPPAYPAAFPAVVAVTAVDGRRQAYIYANRGDYVMFSAFGVDVKAPPGVSRTSLSGTSYASPVVAALIARRMPRQDAHAAAEALAALKSQAIDLGPPGRDPVFGFGLVGDM